MTEEEFGEFFSSYKDKWLGCTMAEAKEGTVYERDYMEWRKLYTVVDQLQCTFFFPFHERGGEW